MTSDRLSDLQHVRERPAMYIGTTSGVFGVIHYLVDATKLVLQNSPTVLEIAASSSGFTISSDISIPVHESENGELFPFERFRSDGNAKVSYGPVVTALSKHFVYTERSDGRHVQYSYRAGVRCTPNEDKCPAEFRSQIEFAPDPSIFEIAPISNYNLISYLNRLSYFNPATQFCFNQNGTKQIFRAENGIADMFVGFASPYQLMHDPIRIQTSEDDFSLEFIFALHSWNNDICCAFVNEGRAVEGGTHKQGLNRAMEHLRNEIFSTANGIVGLLSIHHPNVQWEGCIKSKIANPELESLVFDAIIDGTNKWISDHPKLPEQIENIQTFQFPDAWFA